jgi:hypothetical protein
VIIRIMGEGQLSLDDDAVSQLNEFDSALERAVDANDEAGFSSALQALLATARQLGKPLAVDEIAPSDLILPRDGATMEEVRGLLNDDGLIPG